MTVIIDWLGDTWHVKTSDSSHNASLPLMASSKFKPATVPIGNVPLNSKQ
jgi:hypothetical protein